MKRFLKFGAKWCSQCRHMDRLLETVNFPIEHIDVGEDSNSNLVEKYGISSLPTIVLVNGEGEELQRFKGIVPVNKLEEAIK